MVRHIAVAVLSLSAAAASISPVKASDYMNVCRTADGAYEMNDGQLVATGDARQTPIPYETLQETILSERAGYCIAGGRRYGFEGRTWVAKLRFVANGTTVTVDALCELAADGLPAQYTCEREVVTKNITSGGAARPSGRTAWMHNGSVMRLEANGAERRFVYETPRPGMAEAGARPGDVVFEGRRDGGRYVGTAYIFNRACGRRAYDVAGVVSADKRRVTLEGWAPIPGPNCSVRGTRRDRLVFDLAGP